MRMFKKNWKDRKGVSPVIATILMVAITVVLAAVLYVMVMGFGGDSSSTPAGQITKIDTVTNDKDYKLTLSSFSPETKFADLKINVGGDALTYALTSGKHTWTFGTGDSAVTVTASDLAENGVINQGDSLTIKGPALAGKSISIVHGPSGGLIAERTMPGTPAAGGDENGGGTVDD